MSLWNPRKPINQPPHFRSGQDTKAPVDQVAKEALQALNHARNERSQPKSRKVAP